MSRTSSEWKIIPHLEVHFHWFHLLKMSACVRIFITYSEDNSFRPRKCVWAHCCHDLKKCYKSLISSHLYKCSHQIWLQVLTFLLMLNLWFFFECVCVCSNIFFFKIFYYYYYNYYDCSNNVSFEELMHTDFSN